MNHKRILFVVICLMVSCVLAFMPLSDGCFCAGLFSWIGKAAKGITGIGTALFGGIKSGKERKKAAKAVSEAQNEVNKEKAFNDTIFNREYYQDFLQRSENQAALKMLRDRLKRDNERTEQTAVVTGATPEAVAKQKELSNQAYADTVSKVAANSSTVRDHVMNRYMNARSNLNARLQGVLGQKQNLHTQNAQQWANLMNNGINALSSSFTDNQNSNGGGLADIISNLFKK